jgi:hypothetical protein
VYPSRGAALPKGAVVADAPRALTRSQLLNKGIVLCPAAQGWFRGKISWVGRRGSVTIHCCDPDNPGKLVGFPQHLSLELYHDMRTAGAWVLFHRR